MPDTEQSTPLPAQADASSPAPVPSLADEYDAESPEVTSEPAAPASAVSSPSVAPEARGTDRLRNPDGTYAPILQPERRHSQPMVNMAAELGLTSEEIAGMTPDTLEVAVCHLSKQQRMSQQWQRERQNSVEQTLSQATDRNLAGDQQAGGGSPPDSGPRVQAGAAAPPADDAYDLGIDKTQYDPALIGAIEKLGRDHAKEIKSLKQQIQRLEAVEHLRANETNVQTLDRLFNRDSSLFGEGNLMALPKDSPVILKRQAFLATVEKMSGKTLEEKYEKAKALLYGDAQPPAGDAALAARQDEWRRGNVARPTQRTGAGEPPGTEKAKRGVAAKLQEMNGAADSGEADADDFLE
jgi:hypothetical protein